MTDQHSGIDRRTFLRGAAVAAGAVAVGAVGVATSGEDAEAKRPKLLSWQGRNPLRIPPIVDVAASTDPFELVATNATVAIGGGEVTNAETYNGMMPGPIFLARPGDTARIHLTNQLVDHHITHWHGLVVDHQNDGHPINEVAANGTYSYEFPIVQRASLNFYHPHTHGLTGEQVALGMAGGFLIKDDEEIALPLPPSDREIPLVIRDASLDNSHNMTFSGASKGFFGDFPMVNGTKDPYLKVEPALYRCRVVCGTNSRVLQMKLSDNSPFTIIGNDGGLLAAPAQVSQLRRVQGGVPHPLPPAGS